MRNNKSPRWLRAGVWSAATLLMAGLAVTGWFGWDYAKQTIWLSHEHLTSYQPGVVAEASVKGTIEAGRKPNRKPSSKSGALKSAKGSAKTPAAPVNPAPVQTRGKPTVAEGRATSRMITKPIRLWPTLPEPGQKIGELSFPTLHLNVPVVQGTAWDQLKLGAGHYMGSALPGQGGNVFVAGHRDTVFAALRFLKAGDVIVFSTPYGDFKYKATHFKIVSKYDTSVIRPTSYETLTLSTCYPFFYIGFAPKRYIIYTKLVSEPKIAVEAAAQRRLIARQP